MRHEKTRSFGKKLAHVGELEQLPCQQLEFGNTPWLFDGLRVVVVRYVGLFVDGVHVERSDMMNRVGEYDCKLYWPFILVLEG